MLHSSLLGSSQDIQDVANGVRVVAAPEQSKTVELIQQALVLSGFELPNAGIDGAFGEETGQAVVAFKRDRGLSPADPVVGRGTSRRLDLEAAYMEGVFNDQTLADRKVLAMDPVAGGFADVVRPDLQIPERILQFFELTDEFCFSLGMELTSLAGSFFGRLVEPFINRDFCMRVPPCGGDDFFDVINSSAPYIAFLGPHNPTIPAAVVTAVGRSVRPDILTHRSGGRPEWYGIKPMGPSGLRDALVDGLRLRANYANNGFPYLTGRAYTPSREIKLADLVADGGEHLEVFIEVRRPVPALIFYRFCLRGDYVRYFNRVRMLAGLLAILAALAPELLAAGAKVAEVEALIAALRALATSVGAVLPSVVVQH